MTTKKDFRVTTLNRTLAAMSLLYHTSVLDKYNTLPSGTNKKIILLLKQPRWKRCMNVRCKMNGLVDRITLHFFRDLSAEVRKEVLISFGVLPESWPETLSHAVETTLLRHLLSQGKNEELEEYISEKMDENRGN